MSEYQNKAEHKAEHKAEPEYETQDAFEERVIEIVLDLELLGCLKVVHGGPLRGAALRAGSPRSLG